MQSSLPLKREMCCSVRGLDNRHLQQLHGILDEQVEQNIGMGMIYAMVSAAQEWIADLVPPRSAWPKRVHV